MYWPLQFSTDSSINYCNLSYCLFLVNLAWLLSNLDKFTFKVVSFGTFPLINLKSSCKNFPAYVATYIISFPILIKLIHNPLSKFTTLQSTDIPINETFNRNVSPLAIRPRKEQNICRHSPIVDQSVYTTLTKYIKFWR